PGPGRDLARRGGSAGGGDRTAHPRAAHRRSGLGRRPDRGRAHLRAGGPAGTGMDHPRRSRRGRGEIGRASCRETGTSTEEGGIRDRSVTGVQTCALPIYLDPAGISLAVVDLLAAVIAQRTLAPPTAVPASDVARIADALTSVQADLRAQGWTTPDGHDAAEA